MDYLRKTKNFTRYVLPPRRVDTEGFDQDALTIVAIGKIGELDKRLRKIRKKRSKKKQLNFTFVKKPKHVGLQNVVNEFSYQKEAYFIKRWRLYWQLIAGVKKLKQYKGGFNEEQIEQARSFPIVELLKWPARRSGSRWTAPCPFHNKRGEKEKSRSFYIFEDNSFHCFSCLANGWNAIDFLVKLEDMNFKDAVKRLL